MVRVREVEWHDNEPLGGLGWDVRNVAAQVPLPLRLVPNPVDCSVALLGAPSLELLLTMCKLGCGLPVQDGEGAGADHWLLWRPVDDSGLPPFAPGIFGSGCNDEREIACAAVVALSSAVLMALGFTDVAPCVFVPAARDAPRWKVWRQQTLNNPPPHPPSVPC